MRVYQGRTYKTHSLGIDLLQKDWNEQTEQVKTSHPSHKLHNVKIADLKTKVQKSIFMNDDENETVSADDILNLATRKATRHIKPDILVLKVFLELDVIWQLRAYIYGVRSK